MATSALETRKRWREISRAPRPSALRVALLASYTIDPLAPYLGVLLEEAGHPAEIEIGPYNQIVQQCLDAASQTAATRPDVVVVSPRFEELAGQAGDLLAVADAAVAAVRRWRACLVFVLPAVPEPGWDGIGADGDPAGVPAVAAAAREAVRARLGGLPNVCVADLEAVVRQTGSSGAYHPSLFRFARIPFAEAVFQSLAARVARLLALRFGGGCLAVALDVDSVLLAPGAAEAWPALLPALASLRASGVPVALRSAGSEGRVWRELAWIAPELADELADAWAFDDRAPAAQVAGIAADLGLPPRQVAVVTADPALREGLGGPVPVLVEGKPAGWADQLRASGALDRLPVPAAPAPARQANANGSPSLSLDEFVARLGVEVTCRPLDGGQVSYLAEMSERTHDFNLGIERPEAAIAGELADPGREYLLAGVRDRLGDYGTGGALGLAFADRTCTVDLFLVSCPALGRGVEDELMRHVVARAVERGCERVVLPYRETGRNGPALDFVQRASATAWPGVVVEGRRE
ncbi:MAG: hypothetical protein E6J41_03850 [Chloroflexi bacterium]|nr:MAG: hypothetical protein E6J41_03850 [Chloroflexota bacterium]